MISVGDIVKVKILPQGVEGKVVAISQDAEFYVIEFMDKHNEPYTYSYKRHELIKTTPFMTKCECGAVYVTDSDEFHSTWCPRYMFKGGVNANRIKS